MIRQFRIVAFLVLVAGAGLLAYWPALSLPFISDDYLQVALARQYGPPSHWGDLAQDALYRCRATSLVLTWVIERFFGVEPFWYYVTALVLHIVNCWLVAALATWRRVPQLVAAAAALFFAVHEGHQEAVMWFAAIPELLVFFFMILSGLAWLKWSEREDRRWPLYAASLGCFVLALLSKESAVATTPLLMLASFFNPNWRRNLMSLIPFALLSVIYTLMAFAASADHLHFNDGTFSLKAPFLLVIANSVWRMLWFVGLLAVGTLVFYIRQTAWKKVGLIIAVASIGLLPYSFLTYMPWVPSRHTYLASAALAFLVGLAWVELRGRVKRQAIPALAAVAVIAFNCGYLWVKKYPQYVRRAEPTEKLLEFAKLNPGPIYIRCFPFPGSIAADTLDVMHQRPRSEVVVESSEHAEELPDFCFDRHP